MHACVVVEAARGVLGEPVADFEGFVGEVAGFPDGEAGWVAVPGVVGYGDVAHVVDFFAGVVVVDVFTVAFEVVAAVFYAPEPFCGCEFEAHHAVLFLFFEMRWTYMLLLSKQMPTSLRCP